VTVTLRRDTHFRHGVMPISVGRLGVVSVAVGLRPAAGGKRSGNAGIARHHGSLVPIVRKLHLPFVVTKVQPHGIIWTAYGLKR